MNDTAEMSEKFSENAPSLYEAFSEITDKRAKRGVRYPLAAMLTVVVLAKMSGESHLQGIAEWGQHRAEMLCGALGLKRVRLPHTATYSRILRQVDAQEMQAAIDRALRSQQVGDEHVALDGKTLRGTIAPGQTQGVHLLSAYASDSRVVLAQQTVDSKENELVVAPAVVQALDLHGKVVTGDAMFTQRRLSDLICTAGGDYLWIAKDNQPSLLTMIQTLFMPQQPRPGHGTIPTDFRTVHKVNKGHGRYETRTLTVSHMLHGYSDWPHLNQVFCLHRTRTVYGHPPSSETVYGLTSLSPSAASPARLLALLRRHWSIENQLHHVRDVSLREDLCPVSSPHTQTLLAILNNLIIALVARTSFPFLPSAQRFFNAHPLAALHLLL